MATSRVASGLSGTGWKQEVAHIVSIAVDTSSAKFVTTPVYVTSLYSAAPYWIGVHAIFNPTAKGFTVQLMQHNSGPLTAAEVTQAGTKVAWHGIED